MRDITALHPALQVKAAQLKELCQQQGIYIKYSECLRTIEEQNVLYAKGRTAPGNVVTNATGTSYRSQHQWGIAIDFYLDMDIDGDGDKKDDAFNNSTKLFNRVGAIAKEIGLGWGGDWTSIKDTPHLYLKDWGSTTTKLRNTYGTPQKFFETWGDINTVQKAEAAFTAETPTGYSLKRFIMDVQSCTGSTVDGKAGNETIGNTPTVSKYKNKYHKAVTPLERRLKALGYYHGKIEADHGETPCFGTGMHTAVYEFQKKELGYKYPDGEVTAKKKTWKKLLGMI